MSNSPETFLKSSPVATFVVEREPAKGYRVTARQGEEADVFAEAALKLLDRLGQPDPRAESISFRWLDSVGPTRCCVGVWVSLLPSGEARYQQAWYRSTEQSRKKRAWIWPILLVALAVLSFGGGVFLQQTTTVPEPPPEDAKPVALVIPAPEQQPKLVKLADSLVAAIDAADNPLTVLDEFLGQDGVAAAIDDAGNRSGPQQDNVVKVTATVAFKELAYPEKRFSNHEAAKLLLLIRRLRSFARAIGPDDDEIATDSIHE